MDHINIVFRRRDAAPDCNPFVPEIAGQVLAFHRGFPDYAPTPLCSLRALAEHFGVRGFYVKDESRRFSLNAFKVLGGSYAISRCVARRLNIPEEEMSCERLLSDEISAALGDVTFITATDGNHGRGVAWTAMKLRKRCIVYLPAGTARERLENIRALGADASITDCNYNDTVRLARRTAEENGYILVQDTAWPGYEQVPLNIMQGYTTIGEEIRAQLADVVPTHIFLQAGVGAMAGAMAGYFGALYGANAPRIIIVEPDKADCIYRTAQADDGTLHVVNGRMDTIMAGLACGEVCPPAWEMLRSYAEYYVSMPDAVAAKGMRVLGNPLGEDPRIVSGESGASTTGLAVCALEDEALRAQLGIREDSVLLCISTEGDTDRANYRRIVWDGAFGC